MAATEAGTPLAVSPCHSRVRVPEAVEPRHSREGLTDTTRVDTGRLACNATQFHSTLLQVDLWLIVNSASCSFPGSNGGSIAIYFELKVNSVSCKLLGISGVYGKVWLNCSEWPL